MPVRMVNTAALSKLPADVQLYASASHIASRTGALHLLGQTFGVHTGGKKNHYFKSVWLFVRVTQDRIAEDGKAQPVRIDLCRSLISLTAS